MINEINIKRIENGYVLRYNGYHNDLVYLTKEVYCKDLNAVKIMIDKFNEEE